MNCDCIEQVNARLKEAGQQYEVAPSLIFGDTMQLDVQLSITTRWVGDPPRGKKHKSPPNIICTFCPFCGEKTAKKEEKG